MPLSNIETAEKYLKKNKSAYSKKCTTQDMHLKFIGCMIKFFCFSSAEINVANCFLGKRKKTFFKKKLLHGCLS